MITKQQARRFILAHQGLWPPYELEGKADMLDFIGRVGCNQFDPLNIVGHNPELVLQSRVSGFRPAMLQELLYEDRKLLDGWDKMMAINLTEDWPHFYYRQREAVRRHSRWRDYRHVETVFPEILRAIEDRGPLSSIDLDHDLKVDSADAAASRFQEAGGTVVVPPFDIQIGRAAVVQDPWGNQYVLLDSSKGTLITDPQGNVTGTGHVEPKTTG